MLSRRAFLAGGLAVSVQSMFLMPALAKKNKNAVVSGPRVLSREDWPPPIAPSQVGVTDKGLCCFTDEFGRLALMDFRGKKGTKSAQLIGKVSGIGKRVIDFRVSGSKGYALVSSESDSGESQLLLVGINLYSTPLIVSRTVLDKFTDVTTVAASPTLVCVGGVGTNGESTVAIYSEVKSGRASEPAYLSNFTTDAPVIKMEVQSKFLVVLAGSTSSVLQVINLNDPRAPELRKSLPLKGDFANMAVTGDTALVAGSFEVENKKSSGDVTIAVKSIGLSPIPHVVSQMPLDPLMTVTDVASTKGRFLVLGDTEKDMTIVSMAVDKIGVLYRERDNDPPRLGARLGQSCRLALRDKTAFVATGWSGLKVISLTPTGWKTSYEYTVPRYAASSIASWKNSVVLAGSDLRLYDISQPHSPTLVSVTNLPSYSKNIVGAGSFLVCLLKDTLTLRKMATMKDVAATLAITGNELCFDPVQQKVYVLQTSGNGTGNEPEVQAEPVNEKPSAKNSHESEQMRQVKLERQKKLAKQLKGVRETKIVKIQAYSNSLVSETTYKLDGAFTQASAYDGILLMSNLNNISLFDVTKDEPKLLGSHHFENLALRNGVVTKDHVLLTAVDQASKGFFLVLARDGNDMKVLGSTDLPNDARALAVSKGRAVIIGQKDGKDSAVVVDYKNDATPQVVASLPGIEEAAAVTISDESAIMGGRGLEIVSLS
jgi:hypothetical protein